MPIAKFPLWLEELILNIYYLTKANWPYSSRLTAMSLSSSIVAAAPSQTLLSSELLLQ